MTPLIVFASAFVTVFCLGLQSQNVNHGHYAAAIATSFFISTGSIYLYEYMAVPTLSDKVGFYVGAATGIAFSIWFHRRVKAWLRSRRRRDEHEDVEHCGGYPLRRVGGSGGSAGRPPRFP